MTTFENVVGDWGQEKVFSLAFKPMFKLSAHECITNNHSISKGISILPWFAWRKLVVAA